MVSLQTLLSADVTNLTELALLLDHQLDKHVNISYADVTASDIPWLFTDVIMSCFRASSVEEMMPDATRSLPDTMNKLSISFTCCQFTG